MWLSQGSAAAFNASLWLQSSSPLSFFSNYKHMQNFHFHVLDILKQTVVTTAYFYTVLARK